MRGFAFEEARLRQFAYSEVKPMLRIHPTPVRMYKYVYWMDKDRKDGACIERGVIAQADGLTCPVFWFTANLFVQTHILGLPFPDFDLYLTGATQEQDWTDRPVLIHASNPTKPITIGTHRAHVTTAYKSLNLQLDVCMYVCTRASANFYH